MTTQADIEEAINKWNAAHGDELELMGATSRASIVVTGICHNSEAFHNYMEHYRPAGVRIVDVDVYKYPVPPAVVLDIHSYVGIWNSITGDRIELVRDGALRPHQLAPVDHSPFSPSLVVRGFCSNPGGFQEALDKHVEKNYESVHFIRGAG